MTVRLLCTADTAAWIGYLERLPRKDVTYYPDFMRVYEDYGDGVGECFIYEEGDHVVVYPYIRRPIRALREAPLQDTVNPYCYGGPIHNAADESQARELLSAFRREFDGYARQTGIVSEFIRFHPYLQNQAGYENLIDVMFYRQHVIIDLSLDEDQLLRQCRRSYRQGIQQAKDDGLQLVLDEGHTFIDDFAELYHESMARHNQAGYLNFRPDYFRLLSKHLGDKLKLFLVKSHDRILASALFFPFDDYMDYFLAAATPDAFSQYASHFLLYEVACWARRQGIRIFHLGGGADSLLFFKQGFSKKTTPYYLGKKIHHPEVYTALAESRWRDMGQTWTGQTSYFPAYRYGLE